MAQESIFLPFLAMGLLTFIVLSLIPHRRCLSLQASRASRANDASQCSPI